MVNALVLATEEVNQAGGVLGRPVELVIADGRSDEHEFARLADKLLTQDKVQAIFGCWSSSSRKRVTAACARHQSLLIYACLGEGLELSDHMVNVGGAANQQMQPAVNWAFTELHCRRFFLVGSDYLYSHAAHQILRGYLDKLGATVVGEEYVPLEGTKFAPIIASIQEKKADVIFNTVDGSSNVALFQALRGAGIRPHQLPTFWLSIGEDDMSALRLADLVGDYEAGPYFQSIDAPANHAFHKRYAARYPGRPHIDDETQASYCSLHMWKLAAEKAGSAEPLRVREAFRGLTYEAPEGRMRIDEHNLYAWRMARVGRFTDKHEFEVVFTTPRPLAPQPFPDFRSRAQWEEFTQSLYQRWGGCWEAPRASAVP
jgi:urea transport system substrate-binding protein